MDATPAKDLPEFMRDDRDAKERGALKKNAHHKNQHDGVFGDQGRDGDHHGLLAVNWVECGLHVLRMEPSDAHRVLPRQ